ncbi:MAG TPA: CotH kinase family protein, partial [Verrucomicrobiota bacterium]|nr:CotH kinase family protein [Verrucomicrobiota bacterium]
SSLERITPKVSGERAENWSASPLPEDRERPTGTPGRPNASYSASLPPVISGLKFTPSVPVPGQPTRVQAVVEASDGVAAAELRYRVAEPGVLGDEQVVAMTATDGKNFTGEIPGVAASKLIRVRVRAVDQKKAERFFPSPNAVRPAVSLFVPPDPKATNLALAYIINADPSEFKQMERLRLSSLQPDQGPFGNRERGQLQFMLGTGLDLSRPWFEWTINRPVDPATYHKLRTIFLARQAERNRLIEESMAAPNVAAEIKALPDRIQAFQESFAKQVKAALPAESAAAFDEWFRKQREERGEDEAGMISQFMNVEGAWFGMNKEVDFTSAEIEQLRPVLKAAIQRGVEAAKAMGPNMDFEKLMNQLGEIRGTLDQELRQRLTVRQWHALAEWRGAQASPIRPRLVDPEPRTPRGQTAFVVVEPNTGEVSVFDFLHITERSAGYKVRFHKDKPWKGMTSAAVIFEYNDRFLLAEPLAFELYRRLGNAACQTDFIRLSMNGHALGYQLVVEQVNSAFLRRNHLDPAGDLYKLLWYGSGVEGQHEKQNHPDRTHADLLKLIDALNSTKGDEQWAVIQKNFNVDQVINYFAVNLVLSHWDGFFNNYFAFQDRKGSGKWEMYPWDQDKTWGFHDASGDKVFFDMPVTFGMEGDRPPGGGEPTFNPGSWWRPGGYFSKPLLANPEFRQRYLRRVRQILEDSYTEKIFFPAIDAMVERLKPEIPIRAAVIGEDPGKALARLDRNAASLKEHLVKRRQFLLEQAEIAKLPK